MRMQKRMIYYLKKKQKKLNKREFEMWLAVDESGREYIHQIEPKRSCDFWISNPWNINVPKGTIERLLNYPLTWDDEAEEIVEYKDSNILKEDKVIKQNIKMRVLPEQSKKVQEICFANGISWVSGTNLKHLDEPFIFINDDHSLGYMGINEVEGFLKEGGEEIDADLFIRTNGTCEENSTLNDNSISFKDEEYIKLEKKVFNLKKQLEMYVIKIDSQNEEIARLLSQKEELKYKLNGVTNLIERSNQNNDLRIKYLEEKDAIIKYLENKLEI